MTTNDLGNWRRRTLVCHIAVNLTAALIFGGVLHAFRHHVYSVLAVEGRLERMSKAAEWVIYLPSDELFARHPTYVYLFLIQQFRFIGLAQYICWRTSDGTGRAVASEVVTLGFVVLVTTFVAFGFCIAQPALRTLLSLPPDVLPSSKASSVMAIAFWLLLGCYTVASFVMKRRSARPKQE